jgi:hypothetical protein
MQLLSTAVSVVALAVSLFALWFGVLHRGKVCSTHPVFIAVSYDFVGKKFPQAKIFLRSLLYSTGKRGRVIESLFLRVKEGQRFVEFSFWGYGDKDLVRGSGLFVSEEGIATNHHFNPLKAKEPFIFSGGSYRLELMAKLVGRKSLASLWTIELAVPDNIFGSTIAKDNVIYFNWSPEQNKYLASVEKRSDALHALSDPADT